MTTRKRGGSLPDVAAAAQRGALPASVRRTWELAKSQARRLEQTDHLGPEAVAAFVDGELDEKAMRRARLHAAHCAECRADIREQRRAVQLLHSCAERCEVHASQELLVRLASIAANPAASSEEAAPSGERVQGDFLDRVEMVFRALKHNQRR